MNLTNNSSIKVKRVQENNYIYSNMNVPSFSISRYGFEVHTLMTQFYTLSFPRM